MGEGSPVEIQQFKRMDIFEFWRHYLTFEKDIKEKIEAQKAINANDPGKS